MLNLDETERGNTWLAHSEENWHNAWIKLGNDQWLQISIRPENYPGLTVNTIISTEANLAAHINKEFNSGLWIARKCNIEGVNVGDDGYVVGDEESEESDGS